MANLDSLSAAQIAAGVRNGDFTATEVARADSREKDVQAYLQVSADLALEAAERTDARRAAGEKIGPLAGVPVAFKDNMHLVGTRTTCASKMLENYESVFTATCVQRMLDAGATPVGKANMDEFAFGSTTESSAFHRTNNPWDTSRVPGGSSGGSAAAVAAGEATLALGPFGRRVEDVALAMNALTAPGRDPLDSTSQDCAVDFLEHLDDPVEGLSVGVVPQLMEAKGLSQEVRDALAAALDSLRDQGARVVEVDLPNIASAIAAYYVIAPCEAFSNLARFDGVRYGYQEPDCATLAQQTSLSRAHGFGEEAKRRQMLGAYLLSSGVYEKYYYPAQQVRTLITQDYARAYQSCDVILLPSAPTTAWRFGDVSDPTQMYASDMFTISNNICGNGGVSVPLGLSAQTHMPVSAQLQGPAFSDRRLLRFARAIERGVDQGLGLGGGAPVAPAFAGRGGDL